MNIKKTVSIIAIIIACCIVTVALLLSAFVLFISFFGLPTPFPPKYNYSCSIDDYKSGNYLQYDVTGEIANCFPRYSEIENFATVAKFEFSDYYNLPKKMPKTKSKHQWGTLTIVVDDANFERIKEEVSNSKLIDTYHYASSSPYYESYTCYEINCKTQNFHYEVYFNNEKNTIRYFFSYKTDNVTLRYVNRDFWIDEIYTNEGNLQITDGDSFEDTERRRANNESNSVCSDNYRFNK